MDNERKRQEQERKGQRQGQKFDKDQPATSPGQRQPERSTANDRSGRPPQSTHEEEQITDVAESDLGEDRGVNGADNEEADIPGQPKRTPK